MIQKRRTHKIEAKHMKQENEHKLKKQLIRTYQKAKNIEQIAMRQQEILYSNPRTNFITINP
jgi:hypothetical protein